MKLCLAHAMALQTSKEKAKIQLFKLIISKREKKCKNKCSVEKEEKSNVTEWFFKHTQNVYVN